MLSVCEGARNLVGTLTRTPLLGRALTPGLHTRGLHSTACKQAQIQLHAYAHAPTHPHRHTHTHTHRHTHSRICTHTGNTHTHTHAHTHRQTHTCTHRHCGRLTRAHKGMLTRMCTQARLLAHTHCSFGLPLIQHRRQNGVSAPPLSTGPVSAPMGQYAPMG